MSKRLPKFLKPFRQPSSRNSAGSGPGESHDGSIDVSPRIKAVGAQALRIAKSLS